MRAGVVQGMNLPVKIAEGDSAIFQLNAEAGSWRKVLQFFHGDEMGIHQGMLTLGRTGIYKRITIPNFRFLGQPMG